jgi:hypothetical protein
MIEEERDWQDGVAVGIDELREMELVGKEPYIAVDWDWRIVKLNQNGKEVVGLEIAVDRQDGKEPTGSALEKELERREGD